MTLVAVPGNDIIEYPGGMRNLLAVPASTTLTPGTIALDSASDSGAQGVIAPKTGNIDRIKFRLVTTAAASAGDIDVAIEQTGTNGMPAFVQALWGANTNVGISVAATDDNVWITATLTAAAAVNIDDLFQIVIRNHSVTPTNTQLGTHPTAGGVSPLSGAGSRVRASAALGTPPTVFAELGIQNLNAIFRYDDATWWSAVGTRIYATGAITSFKSDSATNRRGALMTLPWNCRIKGMWAFIANPAANSDFIYRLYLASDGSTLASTQSIDGDHLGGTTIDNWVPGFFTTPYTYTAGTSIRAAVVPGTINAINVGEMDILDADAMSASWGGTNFHRCIYTSGAWDDSSTTVKPLIILMLDQLDNGAGGGGGGTRIIGA